MKFGKQFIEVIEQTQPEFRDKFLCYKQLKKFLKQLPDTSAADAAPAANGAVPAAAEHKRELTAQERDFVRALNAELAKFNEFFMEKEEELVMMDKALGDHAAALAADPAATLGALTAACHGLAKFHGELVLLEHWCSLNYAALVKILKKHDKRSSLSLRLPILVNVLRQPFYSTEVLSQLVRTTEERFHTLAERLKRQAESQQARRAAGGDAGAPGGVSGDAPSASNGGAHASGGDADGGAAADGAAEGDVVLPSLMQLPPPPDDSAPPPPPEEEASMLARTRAALSCWEQLKKSQSLGQPQWVSGASGAARRPADSDSDDDAPAAGAAPSPAKRLRVA